MDEAHQGCTLDAEQRESDLGFRGLADYQSAYRQVFDYFDAVKIALTGTPALHTREITASSETALLPGLIYLALAFVSMPAFLQSCALSA